MYQAILFDLSDTLIEYRPNYATIYGGRLRTLGFQVTDEKADEISRIINWTINKELLLEQQGKVPLSDMELESMLDFAALECVCTDIAQAHRFLHKLRKVAIPKQELCIKKDVLRVLSYLQTKYRLGVVSNHKVWMLDYLKESGLAVYFETIIISDIVGVAKPDPKIMKLALEELKLQGSDCLYVGDQPFDILCAKKAGLDCVWITNDGITPEDMKECEDYRIGQIHELLSIL